MHLQKFNKILDENFCHLDPKDIFSLKSGFQYLLVGSLEKIWVEVMAKSFYPVLTIYDRDEKVAAAQKWTFRYFEGVDYFNQKEKNSTLSVEFVNRLQDKTVCVFGNRCNKEIRKKIGRIESLVKSDPDAFGERYEMLQLKYKENPSSLTDHELDYVRFLQRFKKGTGPEVEQKVNLLKRLFLLDSQFINIWELIFGLIRVKSY